MGPSGYNSLLFPMHDLLEMPTTSELGQLEHASACTGSQAVAVKVAALARPLKGFPTQLLRDVRRCKRHLLQEEDRVDIVLLAAQLSEIGYSVVVRCALGGSQPAGAAASPGNCFRNLRHEFLFVRCESGDFEGVEFLVDPCFREQFAIPQPTAAFRQLLASVPEEFVGTSMRLQPVVELLCAEMAASFESRGLPTPPWRRPAAVLSKFFPKLVKDISISPASGNTPTGMSPAGPLGFPASAKQRDSSLVVHAAQPSSVADASELHTSSPYSHRPQEQNIPPRLQEPLTQGVHKLITAEQQLQRDEVVESPFKKMALMSKGLQGGSPRAEQEVMAQASQNTGSSSQGTNQQQLSMDISLHLYDPPTLQKRVSGAVSLLSVQLAGTSNPASPTATMTAPASPPCALMLGMPQPCDAQHAQHELQLSAKAKLHPPAGSTAQARAIAHRGIAAGQLAPKCTAHPACPQLVIPIMPVTAVKPGSQSTGMHPEVATPTDAEPATIHINWTGGVIHKVKRRGAPA